MGYNIHDIYGFHIGWNFNYTTSVLVGGKLTILKNDGVKVNGVGMTSHI
jgi:hypothetical protein